MTMDVSNRPRVAYMMSRFPKITETFILFEMAAVERLGVQVDLYPLLRERTDVMHPEARPWMERANFTPFISWPIIRANLRMLVRHPRRYLRAAWRLFKGTWGSMRFFMGALGIFPKSVYFAEKMAATGVTHIHAHFASHPAAAAYVIHLLTGIPYSFTAHGSDLHRDQTMLREKVEEAAFVVPISAYNAEIIRGVCRQQDADKLVLIHCGIDTQAFRPASSNGDDTTRRPLNIVNIGTIHEVKGQKYLIEACRLLHERGVDLMCHIIGDGPDREMLEAQAREAGLEDRVCFHGQRVRAEIIEMLQQADVFVAPSVPSSDGRREGIPVVLMEAMASGVPVVASRLSGIPELVHDGECGLLVPPGDSEAIADAIERLAADPALRRRLGEAGRARVLEDFDLMTNASRLVARFSTGVPA